MAQPEVYCQVASHLPGRLRVRLRPARPQPELVQDLHARLQEHPAVASVDSRRASGSVVVHYDPRVLSLEHLLDLFHAAGLIVTSFAGNGEVPAGDDGAADANGQYSESAASIIDALNEADQQVGELTGYRLDLRVLVPLTLGALGVRQLLLRGWGWTELPAFMLLWYAFDAFWKLHRGARTAPGAEHGPAAGGPGGRSCPRAPTRRARRPRLDAASDANRSPVASGAHT